MLSFPTSDISLADRVQLAIRRTEPGLNDVVVDVTGPETIHLSGRVNSFHLRQRAVSVARHIPGVRHLSDGIHVAQSQPRKPR